VTSPDRDPASTLRLDGLAGRLAVVTGAGSGIGAMTAAMLVEQGCTVVGLDRQGTGAGFELLACDVSQPDQVASVFKEIRRSFGQASILVNNAAIYRPIGFEEVTVDDWNQTLAVNLTGAFLTSREVLPAMRAAGYGRLVAVSSTAGKTGGWSPAGAYAPSKAGLMALAKMVAREYAPFGITSNVVAPTMIDTPMIIATPEAAATIPVGRFGTPLDVASMILFLCSAHAGFITGEVINMTGGFYID
jgi:2-hydroxycyclohexanecarboxyl-CoA dehydrogenase